MENKNVSKELILALIKDDLINTKLVNGLNRLDLSADNYLLYASGTVLELMGIESTGTGLSWEKIHDHYMELREKVCQIDVLSSPRLLDALSEEIYLYLKLERDKNLT